jgi:hypothetical protein
MTGTPAARLMVFVLCASFLPGVSGSAEALLPAARTELRAVSDVATTIRQTEARTATLGAQVEDVLRNLDRPGARARGEVRGWDRVVNDLRSEAARARSARAQLGTDALRAEPAGSRPARALRTVQDLDRRLERLDASIGRAERALRTLERRMREPRPADAPPPPTATAPPTAPSAPMDLSGVWLRGKEEWQIKPGRDPNSVVLLDPHRDGVGFDEYTGTAAPTKLRATHRVGAYSDVNRALPAKVRDQVLARGLAFTLDLQVASGGDLLQGTFKGAQVTYDSKTLKVSRIEPRDTKITLVRRGSERTRAEPFLPQPHPRRSGAIGPTAPPAAPAQPSPAPAEVAGVWQTPLGIVVLARDQDRITGRGVSRLDGCLSEYTGRVTRGPGQRTVVTLVNRSSDPKCYENFPPPVAAQVLGKPSNDLELVLDKDGDGLTGRSHHDEVEYETAMLHVLSVRKGPRWDLRWIRAETACPTPAPRFDLSAVRKYLEDPEKRINVRRYSDLIWMRNSAEHIRARMADPTYRFAIPAAERLIPQLRDALVQEYQAALQAYGAGAPAPLNEELRVEAEYIAAHLVDEWNLRRQIYGWDGLTDENAAQKVAQLVNWFLPEDRQVTWGICANWQLAFLDRWQTLDPVPRHFRDLMLRANAGDYYEHNAFGIAPRIPGQELLANATVLDPYRHDDGFWFHGRVGGDAYPWRVQSTLPAELRPGASRPGGR